MTTTTPSLAIKDTPHRAPWGRWGIKSAAFTYLIVLLLIPLSVIFQDGLKDGLVNLWGSISLPIAWAALRLTLWTSALMAVINAGIGGLTAYVLGRDKSSRESFLYGIFELLHA